MLLLPAVAVGFCAFAREAFVWTGLVGAEAGWSAGGNWNQGGKIPGAGDTVVIDGLASAVRQADQPILDVLAKIVITNNTDVATTLYAAKGANVAIRCPVIAVGSYASLGRANEGSLVIRSMLDHSSNGSSLELMGSVTFAAGGAVKSQKASRSFLLRDDGTEVRLAAPLGTGQSFYPLFRIRGKTRLVFDCRDALRETDAEVILGTASNWGGCLDLNGCDQTVSRLSMTPVTSGTKNLATTSITSEAPAVLTVRDRSAANSTAKSEGVVWAPIDGALSIRLDSTTGGSLTITNVPGYPSRTTGGLIASAGTIRLGDGAAFTDLGQLVKTNTGSFVIGDVSLGDSVEAVLSGSGKMTLNGDLQVRHARVWNAAKDDFDYLEPNAYDASNLSAHLAGPGRLLVRKGLPADRQHLVTNDHWFAENARTYAGELPRTGTWTGNAAVADGALAFAATAEAPLSFSPYRMPRGTSIREIGMGMAFGSPATDADLKAAVDDAAKYGVAVVAVDEELRYVMLLNGAWVTNATVAASLDGSDRVVYRIDGIEGEIAYEVRRADGSKARLASAGLEETSFESVNFLGEGRLDDMNGVYYRSTLGIGFLLNLR